MLNMFERKSFRKVMKNNNQELGGLNKTPDLEVDIKRRRF
jgi:hypothetical protein